MSDIATRLLSLVEREMGSIVTLADDPLDAVLTTDLNGDSLHRISLIMEIEDEFQIEISDEEDEALGADATIRDVYFLILEKLVEKAKHEVNMGLTPEMEASIKAFNENIMALTQAALDSQS